LAKYVNHIDSFTGFGAAVGGSIGIFATPIGIGVGTAAGALIGAGVGTIDYGINGSDD
jgi:hypothetical protein